MIYKRKMRMFIDTEDQSFTGMWTYDTNHPLVYKLSMPDDYRISRELENHWRIGRSLVRDAIDNNKLGGTKDVLILPSTSGNTLIYLSNGVDASFIGMRTDELAIFNRMAHRKVSAENEMEIAMDKLMIEVYR